MAVVSEEKDSNGVVRRDSLDNLESLCTISVWLIPQWRTDFGNGAVLFTRKGPGDAARFILQEAVALGACPVVTNKFPAIRAQWRYFENEREGVVAVRLSSQRFSEVQSFLRQAFGPPARQSLKGVREVLVYSGAETNGFELLFDHCPAYTEVLMFRAQPANKLGTNAAVGRERRR